ncbi:Ni(2(+)) ABC transporter membrane subunit NikB [Rhodovastum atsumiense]|uniref:Nickel ABC transporter permease subunit NikB n=1 Tax=Rhodovastum atsumiense TaxID=504468 RepID=A0A5M6J1K8_9PROT|nr:nickel ABC transporter permease subunit NikB [Rhodovastum atsumiense]KAA5614401.1 nickel ABC transporter permease subunit NikB [Rhodovastum atsumiense]CAH2604879.1 Ni(2(+)) ABC transporter membrane subunit NikB [Rhodovastum atsumiense]
MSGFILRRVLSLAPLLLIVSLALFLMLHLGRGDPAMDYLRLSQIPPTDAAVAQARTELGLDRPLAVQYLSWLAGVVRLDFGVSWVTRHPVLEDIATFLPATLQLAAAALALTIVLGVPLGVVAALARNRWPDHLTRVVAFLGVSVPNFWLGYLLILLFAVTLGWLPAMGRGGPEHLILPAIATAAMSASIMLRLVRSSVLGQLGNRHLVFARARGLSERTVIGRHVLLNAMIPPLTAIGLHIGELLGGAMVVEVVFGWPGVGRYALQAISNRDFPALQGFVVVMTMIYVICNLVIDIAYAWIDPRIRLGRTLT